MEKAMILVASSRHSAGGRQPRTIEVAPCTAAAVWQLESSIVVEMLSDQTRQLTEIAAIGTEQNPMYDDLSYVYDDYPIPGCP